MTDLILDATYEEKKMALNILELIVDEKEKGIKGPLFQLMKAFVWELKKEWI